MGLHKLTAGDGYTYLTRQVAVHDATDRGHSGLGDYYSEKGESPGRWWGTGLAALDIGPGAEVTEQQMRNLFGEGRHPDAERLEDAALDAGSSIKVAKKVSQLGRLFGVYLGNAPEFLQETARRFTAYNLERGLRWDTAVPAVERARIRTDLAEEMFAREHERAPLDDRERAGFLARVTRQQNKAVAGYDLTFTPVKTVSALWAVADPVVAGQVEDAHHAAVEQTLAWVEDNVLFTRRGRGGAQQVPAAGLIAAMFTHRDSRARDPHLHTHVAVSNKIQDGTGRWLAIDGRVLYKANVTCSEMYNTLLESELIARLGVRFTDRATDVGARGRKRPVREIDGIDERLTGLWSRRRHAIESRRRELAAAFQAEHGRPPTAGESVALGEQAWSQTRQAKHAPRSEAEQRTLWRREAVEVLGSEKAALTMADGVLGHRAEYQGVTEEWVAATSAAAVDAVQEDRATWQVWHLRAEALRRARTDGIRPADLEAACDRIVTAAIEAHSIAITDPDPLTHTDRAERAGTPLPAALTRPDPIDGTASVYSLHAARLYTSARIVAAEERILTAAKRLGGRKISAVRVGIAVAESAANGLTLNAAQQAMVREMATSGRRVQLALAPAGTGKTAALQVLTQAWSDADGTVLGLAPSAVAAEQLGASIKPTNPGSNGESVRCDTLAKLIWHIHHGHPPTWMHRIGPNTLVLVDEAGMAATTELADAIDYITGRGGLVRLIGDDGQLASVGAGGVLRDIAHRVGAVTLTEVHRFLHSDGSLNLAEAAATLAVRDGDPAALGFYADHGRIHVGDLGSCADQAYAAWAADHAAGGDSVLLAPTRQLVAELNTRARNDRLADSTNREIGRTRVLGDGTVVSAGDPVITRHNDRLLAISNTDWVKNGDRWTVETVHTDGSLTVRHGTLRTKIRLPADYVAEHVQLGYATTVHGAQGITTGTCHVVLTGQEDRNLLYVALSRGRHANHLYLATGTDGDPHNLIHPETLTPSTALDTLATMLRRDGSPVSATTAFRDNTDPARLLHDAATRYHDALSARAEHLIGTAGMEKIERHANALVDGLTDAHAWPTLRSHLALLALEDHNPLTLLTAAVRHGPLADARDPAAALDARIDRYRTDAGATSSDTNLGQGPLPWLPSIPTRLAEDLDWGPYLTARHQQVLDHTKAVTHLARGWTADNSAAAPAWAQPFLEESDTPLRTQLAVWRAAHNTTEEDLRPTGERTIGAPGDHQAALSRAVREARPGYPFAQRSWYQALPEAVRTDPWITPLCQRLARLERAGLPLADYLNAAISGGPLPDEHQAAALWWRLVPHLGPTALDGDAHTADLLTPTWRNVLTDLVGTERADYLAHTPAWPALVAAVDDACQHHGWTPEGILTAELDGIPHDGSLSGAEVADALVFRIARLTDPPPDQQPDPVDNPEGGPGDETDVYAEPIHEPAVNEIASDPFAPPPPWTTEPATTAEFAFPAPGEVPAARILDLNQQALDYYQTCYQRSWAPAYLRDRLGTDLVENPTYTVGYAPPGPHSLLAHLTKLGAEVEELEQAGLVRHRQRRDGTSEYVDVFRDRLILPIHHHDLDELSVVGFLGRRNPTKTDHDYAGPKYLNTKTTAVFTKGQALFGYTEARDALVNGALPVIVEGPIDAYAITLGSRGTAVGIAPMGTVLTLEQIKLLRRHIRLADGRDRIAVATDADPAGWKAAQTAFWNLTATDLDPRLVALPDGLDPADLHATHGPPGIAAAIATRTPLGEVMLEQTLRATGHWSDPAVRQQIVEEAAAILAARGPDTWNDSITRLHRQLHLSPGILEHRTLEASIARDRDPIGYAQARIRQLQDRARAGVSPRVPTTSRTRMSEAAEPIPPRRPREAPARRVEIDPPGR